MEVATANSMSNGKPFRKGLVIVTSLWLAVTTLVCCCLVAGWLGIRCPWLVALYFFVTPLMSIVAFLAYGLDKHRAKKESRRISERTLHWLAGLGGWPGALLGQQWFRHKTQKLKFRLIFWLIVLGHVPLMIGSILLVNVGSS